MILLPDLRTGCILCFLFFLMNVKFIQAKKLFTSSASVFDYILLSITNGKIILYPPSYGGSETSLVPNQAFIPFSKYSCPCVLTAKSWSRIVLSTSLLNNLASFGSSPCLLAFRSHHMLWRAAWKEYLKRNISVFTLLSVNGSWFLL